MNWADQPSTTEGGAAVATDPLPCTADSPSTGDEWTWSLTDMARAWASGQPNHGLVLSAADESATAEYDRGSSPPERPRVRRSTAAPPPPRQTQPVRRLRTS
ncbi:hypothetical protein GT042_05525, partial [Streptomyces sp. SID3212]|nr:hypothetical protein [Streptomyces sp. SID3212]